MNRLKEQVLQELPGSIFEDLYKQVGAEQLCCLFSFGAENVKLAAVIQIANCLERTLKGKFQGQIKM